MPTSTRKKSTPRTTRSISFPVALFDYVTARAKKEKRSFNWIVNDIIEKEMSAGA